MVYYKLGADYFDRLNEEYIVKLLKLRIQNISYQVSVIKGLIPHKPYSIFEVKR